MAYVPKPLSKALSCREWLLATLDGRGGVALSEAGEYVTGVISTDGKVGIRVRNLLAAARIFVVQQGPGCILFF